jgi:colanic acid/amylovoran biosynthesis glycosyltransferase
MGPSACAHANVDPGAVSIVHGLDCYLPMTENWIYRLIRHVPGCRQLVAAPRFTDNGFDLPQVEFLRPPMQLQHDGAATFPRRLVDTCLSKLYPLYLRLRLRDRRIAIFHSHFANNGWRYRRLASALGASHVVSFYGWDYMHLGYVRPRWQGRIRQLFRDADLLVCEGPHGAQTLAGLGCPADKIRICRLGVETDRIPVHARTKHGGELKLLQIASFREKKGHVYTARAFIQAAADCPGATLTLVGSGDASIIDEVRAMISSAGLSDRVTLLPGIDFSRLHAFMADYHVFIHPSVHTAQMDCEGGAPVVLLDAQATGMPVIATRHCDIPSEIVEGSTGLLVDERDVDGLADAIRRFCAMDQAEYDGFAARARAHVCEHFDARACSASLAEVYRELATPGIYLGDHT